VVQKPQYYKLIGRLPVPIKSIYLYDKHNRPIGIDPDPIVQKDFTDAFKNRIVARTKIGPMDVSTVFLALDHAYSPDPDALPILFETMIFGDNEDAYQERYSTWDEAEKGHAKAVKYAEALLAKAQTIL
jgi:hypothetical protein